jgi:hypothetical protein
MGVYELDDDQVRRFLASADPNIDDPETAAMIDVLRPQVPIPVPQGIGAVVVTDAEVVGRAIYIRWAHDNATTSPWIAAGNHEEPYRTDEIGKIIEVLSEGVDI